MPNLTKGRKHPQREVLTRKIERNILRRLIADDARKNKRNRFWRRERFRAAWARRRSS